MLVIAFWRLGEGTYDLSIYTQPWHYNVPCQNQSPIDHLPCAAGSIFQSPLIFKWQGLKECVADCWSFIFTDSDFGIAR